MNTIQVDITKSPRGWHCEVLSWAPGFPNPSRTISGERTLPWALLQTLEPVADQRAILTTLTVKGAPMTPADAYLNGGGQGSQVTLPCGTS